MTRRIEPEFLDELPPEHSGAIGSRKDLLRLNRLMLNGRTMARAVRHAFGVPPLGGSASADGENPPPKAGAPNRLLDLGGGDGKSMLDVARRLGPKWKGTHLVLLDRHNVLRPETRAGFDALAWRAEVLTADVFDWLNREPETPLFDAILVNLFLHHFTELRLQQMFKALSARTRLIVAVEPGRSRAALALSKCLWLIGCNRVTRHDAVASVRAGFTRNELSQLWPAAEPWQLQEHPAGFCAHLFVAQKIASHGKAQDHRMPSSRVSISR